MTMYFIIFTLKIDIWAIYIVYHFCFTDKETKAYESEVIYSSVQN